MFKKISIKTNFVLIGIVVGLFVGVSVRQALGDSTSVPGTVRADNLTVNTSGQYTNGLIVANGNALVAGKVGVGTINPSEALTVTGKILSSGGFCIGTSCVTQWDDLKTMLGIGTTVVTPPTIPTSYSLAVIKEGTGTGTVVSAPAGINCGSACAYTFSSGASVTLTANKATGSVFTGWSDACTGTSISCTVVMSAVKNVRAMFSSGTETPQPVCTGTPPPTGTGVVVTDYTTTVISPYTGSSNTVWGYVTDVVGGPSCTWGCAAPMEQNGDIGCKNPTSGSGTSVTINKLDGGSASGIKVTPTTIIGLTGISAIGLNGNNGIFTTNSGGTTPEFWFSNLGGSGTWTTIGVDVSGYKIRSATGCTPDTRIYANKQVNYCSGAINRIPVTIDLVPGDISTLPTTHFEKLTYHRGETLKGSITGGNPNDTWACMDNPSTASDHLCNSGRTDVWRKLTVPYDGHADGWQLVETDQGDSIQLEGLLIEQGFPFGTYTQYVKTGQWGVPSQTTSKSITVVSGGDSNVPALGLSVANSSVASNASTIISWIPTNATWCWAEPWNTPTGTGWKAFSSGTHTESTGNLTTTQTYTMKCGNGNASQDVTKSVTVHVTTDSNLTITTTSVPDAIVGVPYTFTFASTGGTASIWNIDPYNGSVSLGGLEWHNGDSFGSSGLGVISGIPTTAGTYRFTITVNNSVSKEFTLVVK